MTCRHTPYILIAAVFVIVAANGAIASTDTAAKRFLDRFETLCLMPIDDTAPATVAGSIAVQQVSARAAEHGFLVNETLFSIADRATLTPFALYLASKGDGLAIMHDLRVVGALIEDQKHFSCMFSSKQISADELRTLLEGRLGVVQFEENVLLYARNGATHRVHVNIDPDIGTTLVRNTPLPDPSDPGTDQ